MKEYQLTARAQALRNRMVEQPAVCTERAVYLTESWQNTEGVPAPLRRARALRNVLEHMTIRIEPGELLVGNHTSKIRGRIDAGIEQRLDSGRDGLPVHPGI